MSQQYQNQKIKWHNKAIEKALDLLDLCKVCGGSHGAWLNRNDYAKKLKGLKIEISTDSQGVKK